MRFLFFLIIFFVSVDLYAATGNGEAQVSLTAPLTVVNARNVNFGTIAIDPAAGPQTVVIGGAGLVTCPAAYVCTGSTTDGIIQITGAPGALVNLDITGSTATLDDGTGNTLIFDPIFSGNVDVLFSVSLGGGTTHIPVRGSIDFTGSEFAGTYTSANGSGYTVTVNY